MINCSIFPLEPLDELFVAHQAKVFLAEGLIENVFQFVAH